MKLSHDPKHYSILPPKECDILLNLSEKKKDTGAEKSLIISPPTG